MRVRFVNALLALIALIGVGFAIRATVRSRALDAELERATAAAHLVRSDDVFEFENTDHSPRDIRVVLIERPDPFTYKWRVFDPVVNSRVSFGGKSTNCNGVFVVRILKNDNRQQIGMTSGGPSGSFGYPQVSGPSGPGYDKIIAHWDQLQVSLLGDDCLQLIPKDEVRELISIKIPDAVWEKLTVDEQRNWEREIVTAHIGSRQAIEAQGR